MSGPGYVCGKKGHARTVRPIEFRVDTSPGWFRAVFQTEDELLDHTWPGLLAEEVFEVAGDKWWSYGAYGDSFAAFLALAWRTAAGDRAIFALPAYYGERAEERLGCPGVKVQWGFRAEEDPFAPRPEKRGFERGRTLDIQGRKGMVPGIWDHALLFEVPTWLDLAAMHVAIRGDAANEIALFALRHGRGPDLRHLLTSDDCPDLRSFLLPGERFITVVTAEDMGYTNSVTVEAPDDLRQHCENATGQLSRRLAEYEDYVGSITNIDEFIECVTRFIDDD